MASKLANIRTNDQELRIVMVGKTGVGKSATGNTILGRKCFKSKLSAASLTVDCSKDKGEVNGQKVSIIDTPGLFDTRFGSHKTAKDICQCISFASPGPHVFLVVIRLNRFTDEEKQTVQRIQEIFGQAADKYSMVLFTGGDDLEDSTIEEFMSGSEDLQELVSRCNGQYHVLNNKKQDRLQVSELFKKIRDIVQKNGGSHYTSEMFQEAERAIEEEKQRILKETEEKRRKEIEKLEREAQEKYEKQIQKMNEQIQAERERERKEREEERKREKQEMEEQKRREREEREEERKREKQEMNEERRREKQEMEEQRRREREAMEEERKREREAREAERERERQEKERENENRMKLLKEENERKLNEEKKRLKAKQEEEARTQAEESNPFYYVKRAGECIGDGIVLLGKAGGAVISNMGKKFKSWFG